MRILVTGSSGHLGEALMRTLRADGADVSASTCRVAVHDVVGSITDRDLVRRCDGRVDAVLHAATLHKPHVATHSRQAFVDTNVTGTLNLLEEAVAAGVARFVFTSTTSAFGRALDPPPGAPAAWITEDVAPVPRNIYGVTKTAAEDLCELFHRLHGLPCIVLRTSRFFPEEDDRATSAPRTTTRTSRRTSSSTAASTSRTSSTPTCSRSSTRPRSASGDTSSARPRRSSRDDLADLARTRRRCSRRRFRSTRRSTPARLADVPDASTAST